MVRAGGGRDGAEYVVEIYDRDLGDFVEVTEQEVLLERDVTIEWGQTRPARLLIDGVEALERFRLWEVVSAGTDRLLLLEAISGLPALYEARPLT